MSNIGTVIRKYRLTQEIDQKDLAESIGIKPAVLSRLESGKDVSQDSVIRLIDWLFSDRPVNTEHPDQLKLTYEGERDA